MTVWAALLRAVNVGGTGRLPMPQLREMLAGLGLRDVQTYIQSGNAVFRSDLDAETLSAQIGDAIAGRFGFRPPVVMLSQAELEAALAANPFAALAQDARAQHAFCMDRPLTGAEFAAVSAAVVAGEALFTQGRVLWLHLPAGIGRSGVARRAMGLKQPVTARNLTTMLAIAALARTCAEHGI